MKVMMQSRLAIPTLAFLVVNTSLWFNSQAQDNKHQTVDKNQILYQQGQKFQELLQFDSAIVNYTRYLERVSRQGGARLKHVEKRITECESGKILAASPRKFVVTSLGPTVNSPFEDYAPVLSEDESLLVFTSRRPDGNISREKSADGKYFEDILLARQVNGQWSVAQNIGPPVNTRYHDSNLALSADGKLLFTYSDANEGDILSSNFLNGRWSQPKPMPSPINSPYHESSISTDGKRFFVASERPGGLGGSDIWLIEKDQSGQWQSSNLGPSVNTEWDEDGPFIDYDGTTLYFSSKGHNAMGGFDIFRSSWIRDHWLEAENLGYPINTPGNESYFVGTKDGKRAYYSSVREGGLGEEDIYMIALPKELERSDKIDLNIDPLVIYFEFRSSQLSTASQEQLRIFSGRMMGSTFMIHIDGHTDNVGQEVFNKDLSLARASSVYSFLKQNGIDPERLVVKGWGIKKPVASNDNEKNGRALNRRVEITVIDN